MNKQEMLYVKKPHPVTAVQWIKHGDHESVRQLTTEHDPRLDGDDRPVGICETHYGRHFIHSTDWILRDHRGFLVAVIHDWEFKAQYVLASEG